MPYTPHRWLIVRVNVADPFYKVLGVWYGGYLHGDSWRMNSGIERVVEEEKGYELHGSSGSVYLCGKENYGTSAYGASILEGYKDLVTPLSEVDAIKILEGLK